MFSSYTAAQRRGRFFTTKHTKHTKAEPLSITLAA